MNRRSFAQSIGGAAMLSAVTSASSWAGAGERKASLYRLEYLYLRQQNQRSAVHDFLASQVPLLERLTRKLGVFTAITGPRVPATLILSGFTSFEDMEATDALILRDAAYRSALEKMEKAAGQPYDRARVLLRPSEFSGEIANSKSKLKEPRVFELRVYHSPSEPQLRHLHEQLAKPEVGVFSRAGIQPLLQADTLVGPSLPNLTYLIPFADLAQREKAWDAAAIDAEWSRAHEPGVPGNQVVADILLLRPTPFSPIQ